MKLYRIKASAGTRKQFRPRKTRMVTRAVITSANDYEQAHKRDPTVERKLVELEPKTVLGRLIERVRRWRRSV